MTYEPPTDEQLARFVAATVMGESRRRGIDANAAFAAEMVMRTPALKEAWLQRHRDLQAAIRSEPPSPALPAKSKEME